MKPSLAVLKSHKTVFEAGLSRIIRLFISLPRDRRSQLSPGFSYSSPKPFTVRLLCSFHTLEKIAESPVQ